MFIIMGFRNAAMIGNDSATSYYQAFLDFRLPNYQIGDNNKLFYYIMSVIFRISGNYQIFIIIEAAIINYSIYKLIKKYSYNYYTL